MSVIEQAAKRLRELRGAGIDVAQAPVAREAAETEVTDPNSASRAASRRGAEARATQPLQSDAQRSSVDTVTESRRVELDLARIASFGIVTPDAPRSRVADEFRVVKR